MELEPATMSKAEWREVARVFKPEWTDADYEHYWQEFVRDREQHRNRQRMHLVPANERLAQQRREPRVRTLLASFRKQ